MKELLDGVRTINEVEELQVCVNDHPRYGTHQLHCKSGNRRLYAYKQYARMIANPDLMVRVTVVPMDDHFRRGYTTLTRGETIRFKLWPGEGLAGPSWDFSDQEIEVLVNRERLLYFEQLEIPTFYDRYGKIIPITSRFI